MPHFDISMKIILLIYIPRALIHLLFRMTRPYIMRSHLDRLLRYPNSRKTFTMLLKADSKITDVRKVEGALSRPRTADAGRSFYFDSSSVLRILFVDEIFSH